MTENSLSVCIITKNEEKNIEKCIKSIINIADEIIILDTGSIDDTVELAKKWDAKVYNHVWNHDFSEARNASIDKAVCKWILFLDADEEIPEQDGIEIKNLLATNSRYEAYYLRLVNMIGGANVGDSIVLRVFKNRPEYRFKGRMHEQIINSIQEKSGFNCIKSTAIRILHYGYDPKIFDINKKQKRNIELLNAYPENERDGYYYYSLGNEYSRIGENEKAISIYNQALKKTNLKKGRPIYYAYLILNMAKSLFICGKFNEEIILLEETVILKYEFRDAYFLLCLAYIECSKFTDAKKSLLNYLNYNQSDYESPSNNFQKLYDIENILMQLNNASINSEKNLLSILILADKSEETLVETIKSVNEISCEVIIVIPNNLVCDINAAVNLGAKVIESASYNKTTNIVLGIKNCKGKYVLLINPGEVCSFESQKNLISSINLYAADVFRMFIYQQDISMPDTEIRLFRNSKKIKNYKNYIDFLNKKDPIDLEIYLHKLPGKGVLAGGKL